VINKQSELGFDDEKFREYLSFFLDVEPEELFEELATSVEPISNKILSGSLCKILGVNPKTLYKIRDKELVEVEGEGREEVGIKKTSLKKTVRKKRAGV
jgi:hypothetical protein